METLNIWELGINHFFILGIALELPYNQGYRVMQGVFSNAFHINLFLVIFPYTKLHCKQVLHELQYWEYQNW